MTKTSLIVILFAIILFIFVLELVRRRRLRIEYSWLWLFTVVVYLIVAIWPQFSEFISRLMGVVNPVIALTFIALQFLLLILIQFSVHLTKLDNQVKNLTQLVALIDTELHEIVDKRPTETSKNHKMTKIDGEEMNEDH